MEARLSLSEAVIIFTHNCLHKDVRVCVSFILFRIPFITTLPQLLQGTEEIRKWISGYQERKSVLECKGGPWPPSGARMSLHQLPLQHSGLSWQFELCCE